MIGIRLQLPLRNLPCLPAAAPLLQMPVWVSCGIGETGDGVPGIMGRVVCRRWPFGLSDGEDGRLPLALLTARQYPAHRSLALASPPSGATMRRRLLVAQLFWLRMCGSHACVR